MRRAARIGVRAAAAGGALLAGLAVAQPPAASRADTAHPREKLEVCADPNNLPFSNREGAGFENRLAEIWGRELGLEVEYTWFPQRRGFERHTLTAQDPETGEYLCDVIIGVPDGYDLAMTTEPYYRSTYALVFVRDGGLDIESGEELVALPADERDGLRIGVFTPGPAAEWLARSGMHEQMVAYPALQGDPGAYPGQIIEHELLAGELDAAILWGPIAGYFAARAAPREVVVLPLESEPGVQFEYAIAAGVRFGDRAWRAQLEEVMARTAGETAALLAEYHVPVVEPVQDDGAAAPSAAAARSAPAAAPAADEPPAELVYVSNEDAGTISILSAATHAVVGEIEVGTRPRGIEVSPDGNFVYVALSGSPKCPPAMPDEECAQLAADKSKDGIGVVDARARKLVRVLEGGSDPEEFDVDAAGERLFVSNEDADLLSIVEIATGRVTQSVAVGKEPEGVRLSPDELLVYVTSESDHGVTVVDAQTGEARGSIPVGWRPRDSIFSADGSRAYVSAEHGGSVAVIDVAASTVLDTIELPAGSLPMGLALSPDERRLYVANGRAQTVSVIDLEAGELTGEVRVGARPWGIGITADGKWLYTANGPSNDVSVIDAESLEVVATIPVGAAPWGIAIGPAPR
ncbi:MAG TPA: quinoprotein dehydrogenase-associated putative ABC transporter substrate-binding protein [Gammaproteobacteria bacterium]